MAGGSTFTAIFDAQDNMSSVLSGMSSSGKSLESTLTKLAGTAAAFFGAKKLVDFGKEAMSVSREFESGMAEVFTLLPNMSKTAMDGMTADVKDFVKETGNSLNDTTSALYQAISAGVSQDNAMDFMRTANMAAVGGVSDLETAVDGLTSVTNAYGLENLSTARASDLMFQTVKLGKTTFGELSHSLYNVIPTAVGAGVSFDDVSASLAAMTAQGVPTASATVKLRQAITELSNSGTEVDKTFRSVAGKSFKEFISEGGNLQGALQILEKHAKASGLGIADMFSSVQAGSAALLLTGQATEKFTQAIEGMANSAGATEEAYKTMENTAEHRIKKMKAAWEVMKADIGAGLSDALTPIMETISGNMDSITGVVSSIWGVLTSAFKGVVNLLAPIVRGIVKHIDLVKAALAGIGTAFAVTKIIGGMTSIISLVSKLSTMLNSTSLLTGAELLLGPAGIIALGVGAATALGFALAHAYEESQKFGTGLNETASNLTSNVDRMNELSALSQEMKKLDLVIKSNSSSTEEVEQARSRLEEIKSILSEKYKLNIDVDNSQLEKTVSLLTQKEYMEAKGNRDTLIGGLQTGFDSYAENKFTKLDALDNRYKVLDDQYNYYLDLYNQAIARGEDGSGAKWEMQKRQDWMTNNRNERSGVQDEVDAYEANAKTAADDTLSMLKYDVNNHKDTAADIEALSSVMKLGILPATDYANGVLLAQRQMQSFDEVVGKGPEALTQYISDYAEMGKKFGMSSYDIAQGQGLLANGFVDMQSALNSTDPNALSAVANSMTEYARAAGVIGNNQVIEINAKGDVSVVDEAIRKIDEIHNQGNVDVSVLANGDISIMDIATGQIQTLSGMGAVSLQVNADGNIEVLNEAQQAIATVDSKTAELSVDGQVVNLAEIEAANSAKDKMEDKDTSLNVLGNFDNKKDIEDAISYQGQLKDKSVTYTVTYKQNGSPPPAQFVAGNAQGTSYWQGGLTYVNDQAGIADPTELIYEHGKLFTYAGKNVLANLEKGAKIIKASETSAIMGGNLDLLRRRIGDIAYSKLGDVIGHSSFENAPIPEIPAYATGTTSSADTFIAGEEGPELVLGKKDSTVFPADETRRILDRFENSDYRLEPNDSSDGRSERDVAVKAGGGNYVIELRGSGKVQMSGKDEAVRYVMENIRPIIYSIFEQEVYEEGERSVDF